MTRVINQNGKKHGVAMLFVLLVLSASALIMAYGVIFLGLGELGMGFAVSRGNEAFSIADGCMEEALRRLRTDSAYTGGSLIASNGSCTIVVSGSGGVGTTRSIVVESVSDIYHKKLRATITLTASNSLVVNSWEERND